MSEWRCTGECREVKRPTHIDAYGKQLQQKWVKDYSIASEFYHQQEEWRDVPVFMEQIPS